MSAAVTATSGKSELQGPHQPQGLLDRLDAPTWAMTIGAARTGGHVHDQRCDARVGRGRDPIQQAGRVEDDVLATHRHQPGPPLGQADHLAMDGRHDLVADLPDTGVVQGLEDPIAERRPDLLLDPRPAGSPSRDASPRGDGRAAPGRPG